MAVIILGYLLSVIPTVALFLWLRNSLRKDDAAYRKLCGETLRRGVLCTFPIIAGSGILSLLLAVSGIKNSSQLLYQALYDFIAIALVEETVKFLTFRRSLEKTDYPYSWMDITAIMTIVGLGFGAAENIVVAINSGIVPMLIRAVTIAHGGYGFVVGYFYGKGVKTGKGIYKVIGFVLIWLMHGLYDFSLSDEFIAVNDNLVVVAVLLAVLDLVLAVALIVFFAKARKQERYTEPLHRMEQIPEI